MLVTKGLECCAKVQPTKLQYMDGIYLLRACVSIHASPNCWANVRLKQYANVALND